MKASVVKINPENYFIDAVTSHPLEKFEQGCNFRFGDSVVSPYYDYRSRNETFDIGEDKYIIDDHYQSMLIRAGYLVYQDFDSRYITDKTEGWEIHDKLVELIKNSMEKIHGLSNSDWSDNNRIKFVILQNNYKYTVYISDVSVIVRKNQERKVNMLSFYPFDKNMDKYGTVYLSIYAQKLFKDNSMNGRYSAADDIIRTIVTNAPDVKYAAMEIRQPTFYIEEA